MNEVPPGRDDPDDVDGLYRRAAAGEDSRPSEWVRHAVLAHAAHLAAERSRQAGHDRKATHREVHQTWRRPAIFGTLAAAALAGLLVAPHFLPPPAPSVAVMSQAPATSAPQPETSQYMAPEAARSEKAAPPAAPPAVASPSAPPRAAPGMLARQRASSAAPAETSARNATSSADATTSPKDTVTSSEDKVTSSAGAAASLAAKNAPSKVAGTLAAQRAGAAATAGAAARVNSGAQLRQAAESGNAPQLQRLLDEQADIDARDESGRTALLLAVQHGEADAVDVLLAHGADPNAADSGGDTPLKAAIERHQQAIAAALQRAGAR